MMPVQWSEDEVLQWTYAIDYPLIACIDRSRPHELHMMHMTNGLSKQVSLQLPKDKRLQFVAFVNNNSMETNTQIKFLAHDYPKKRTYVCSIKLKNPFLR